MELDERRVRMELQDMKRIRENEAVNADAIANLSDKMQELMTKVQEMENRQ